MTYEELKYRQSWTLEQKIDHAVGVVSHFRERMNGQIYVSFSGGKDSTVMLDIIRRFVDPNALAVFCNTGNEFPEIVKFVRSTENVKIIRPKTSLKKVIEKYGFPLVSKEQSQYIYEYRHAKSEKHKSKRFSGKVNKNGRVVGKISEKWKFLIDAPFELSEKCCNKLKKEPFSLFEKESGLFPIIGTMVEESSVRMQKWLKAGCNSFDSVRIASYPLSIFLENDIWEYIRLFDLPYCPVYNIPGQKRTGCVICGFGFDRPGDDRFYRLKEYKPKMYDALMKYENNGVSYMQALRFCNIDFPDARIIQTKINF